MNTPINFARSLAALFMGFFASAGVNTILTALLRKFLLPATMDALTATQTLCLLAATALSGLVGGYVAAALAGSRRWLHALLLAGIIMSAGLLFLWLARNVPRSAYSTYALIVLPLSIVVGGWLRHRKA